MALLPTHGPQFLQALCDALGVTGPVRRVVIDCAVDEATMVYVQRSLDRREGEAALKVLAEASDVRVVECEDVGVDEFGRVKP